MKELIEGIKKEILHPSRAVIINDLNKEYVINELKTNIPNRILKFTDNCKKSLMAFLSENNIKYPKSADIIKLTEIIVKNIKYLEKEQYYNSYDFSIIKTHLIIDLTEHSLDMKELEKISKVLVLLYKILYERSYKREQVYPILVTNKTIYMFLRRLNEEMWRYQYYIPKCDFFIDTGLWIEDYECISCGSKSKVLVGIKIEDKYYSVLNFKEEAIGFIKDEFEEAEELNLEIDSIGEMKEICNVCPKCNIKISGLYMYDEFFEKEKLQNFKNIEVRQIELPYNRIRENLDMEN